MFQWFVQQFVIMYRTMTKFKRRTIIHNENTKRILDKAKKAEFVRDLRRLACNRSPKIRYLAITLLIELTKREGVAKAKRIEFSIDQINDADGNETNTYIVCVKGHSDQKLIELGSEPHAFPRGMPLIWVPGVSIYFGGFLPKFDNDTRAPKNVDMDVKENDKLTVSFKLSGFMEQLIPVKINGVIGLVVCSKNSGDGDSPFVKMAIEMFKAYEEKFGCVDVEHLYKIGRHFCCEGLNNKDACHGYETENNGFCVHALMKGTYARIEDTDDNTGMTDDQIGELTKEQLEELQKVHLKNIPASENPKFVTPVNGEEKKQLCKLVNLPVGDVIELSGKKLINEFLTVLAEIRDLVDYPKMVALLTRFERNYPGAVSWIKGTMPHEYFSTYVLEGLVLFLTHGDGTVDILKVKFPGYTSRTFCIRTMINQHGTQFDENVAKSMAIKFVTDWCVSVKGQRFWYNCIMKAVRLILKGEVNENTRPGVGLHITAMDIVMSQYHEFGEGDLEEIPNHIDINSVTSAMRRGVVVCVLGPIGIGKSYLADMIARLLIIAGFLAVHLDCDTLFGRILGHYLKYERNNYTAWKALCALMKENILVTSLGGGQFINVKKNENVLKEIARKVLGVELTFVYVIPDNMEEIYADTASVISRTNKRIKSGTWGPMSKEDIMKIAKQSANNVEFARMARILAAKANEHVFDHTYQAGKDEATCAKIIQHIMELPAEQLYLPHNIKAKVTQWRILCLVDGMPHHITIMFNLNGITIGAEEFLKRFVTNGRKVTATGAKGNFTLIVMQEQPFHGVEDAHITVNAGKFAPANARIITNALRNGCATVQLTDKKGDEHTLVLPKLDSQPVVNVDVIDMYAIP